MYLTSQRQPVSAGYSYTGVRKLSLGLPTSYMTTESRALTLGRLSSVRGGGGINYRINGPMNFSSQLDYRTFSAPNLRGREGYAFMLGLTLSPTQLRLSIW